MDIIKHTINNVIVYEYAKTSIYVIENILDDNFCEEMINYINSVELIDSIFENPNNRLLNCKYLHLDKYNEKHIEYDFKIYQVIHIIFLIMMKIIPSLHITGDTIYHLRKIYGATKLHTDSVRSSHNDYYFNKVRCMAAILTLNDNYNGGEFIFPTQNINIKLKKGSVLLFPPFWTHPHEVSKIEDNQFRYTITTWGTEDVV